MITEHQERAAQSQEIFSRYLEVFRTRWQPKAVDPGADDDDSWNARNDRREFEIELMNLVQAAFASAQAQFARELDSYRQLRCMARF